MASLSEIFPVHTLLLQTPPPPSHNETLNVIPEGIKDLWEEWNIRSLILFSLSLQTFLILCAPFRKRTSRKLTMFLLWSAYLLADWAASFIVGLISNNNSDSKDNSKSGIDPNLLAFWAPFLLLHLGGPDTITAFALEDNALWRRHLIQLIFQVVATVYIFIQTVPLNRLWVPAILMFVAGIIKYAERTRALYLASLGSFRTSMLKEPDPGPNYAKLMEEYSSNVSAHLPTRIDLVDAPKKEWSAFVTSSKRGELNELEIVQYAFLYFNKFKGLIVDLIFSFKERNESRDFFLERTAIDALKIIEVELSFIYEALFTKVVVLHNKCGWFFRFICVACVITALVLFTQFHKTGVAPVDVRITYALLIGALALDLIAISMSVFSNWTVSSLKKDGSCVAEGFKCLLKFKGQKLSKHKGNGSPCNGLEKLDTSRFFRRWRESVSQFNLISYCLCEREYDMKSNPICCGFNSHVAAWNQIVLICLRVKNSVVDYFGMKEFLDDCNYVYRNPVFVELWTLIFTELKQKSEAAETAEVTEAICSSRGSYVLKSMEIEPVANIDALISYIDDVAFDESLVLWHIATELCYRHDIKNGSNKEQNATREFSKILSDYMLYLLMMLPSMMSAVAGIGEIRFRDTCAEAKIFFDRRGFPCNSKDEAMATACLEILDVKTEVKPVTVKGDRSKSVLFDAPILARKLQDFKDKKWEIMSKVWIEMLGYAASHCRPDQHAQQVSKGGELITLIWLLMAHFGLGEQFQISQGHARAKLRVEK